MKRKNLSRKLPSLSVVNIENSPVDVKKESPIVA